MNRWYLINDLQKMPAPPQTLKRLARMTDGRRSRRDVAHGRQSLLDTLCEDSEQ